MRMTPSFELEPVHLDEGLVRVCSRSSVPAAEASAGDAHGVDLVDEDDARRVLLALLEQIAHAARADAAKHLDEVRTEMRRTAPASPRWPASSRLARPGEPIRSTPWDAAAQLGELLRVLQEGDDLLELFLGLVDAATSR